jgi:hypothetical protein
VSPKIFITGGISVATVALKKIVMKSGSTGILDQQIEEFLELPFVYQERSFDNFWDLCNSVNTGELNLGQPGNGLDTNLSLVFDSIMDQLPNTNLFATHIHAHGIVDLEIKLLEDKESLITEEMIVDQLKRLNQAGVNTCRAKRK